ncbi:HEAT repeat-containing protein 5B-like isoform X1 [Dermacentor silvarum]|uniref:HEAT repeat-containing protein 5B-like isoform X1 n=1 Tax=Dermacentor silvarum TaxID=543639 RepID=UPI00189A3212|nr:HEAT repeat-containing protein 5B-like isoform X1 [Dermacentor silvarum]
MMELSHSLTLNEEVLAQLPEVKRPVFVFEWLRFLDKVLVAAQKSDIKQCQKQLVEQLVRQMREGSPGPPTRRMLGRCLATLFSVGDTFLLFDAVNQCNDILRNRDDSPSYLPARLAAITSTGAMYEKLGRMMGRSYEDTVHILLKSLRNAESQSRCETMHTMEKMVAGMGVAASTVHKDIFKAVRHCMTDRVLAVRCAAAKCLLEMVWHAPFLYTSDLETVASICFRAFEGSNYEVRCTVARLLGTVVAITQQASQAQVGKNRLASLDEVLGLLASGFLRGGIGFLKGSAGEMIKGGSSVSREIRVGVTHAYVVLFQRLGGLWLERHLPAVLSHLLELVGHPRAVQTHVDAVYSRKCVSFALRSVLGKMLGDKAQAAACKDLVQVIVKHLNSDAVLDSNSGKDGQQEVALSQHILVCALQELGCLVETLGTTAVSTLSDSSIGLVETVVSVLIHTSPAARLAAAWCLRCIATAVPAQLTPLLDRCLDQLESMKSSPDAIAGYSAALAALLGAARHTPLGLPHNKGKMIFNLAEDLLRSASQNSRLSLQRTQAGWLMMGAVMTLGPPVVRSLLPRMLLLWKNCFPRSTKELESEKVRGDAFTWQVTLEGRSGALSAMASFLRHCKELASDDIVRRILSPVESALLMLSGIGPTIKSYGQHLKASAAMVRLRLYETMSLLPAQSYESSYNNLLRLLVAEFTLTENQANTTTSLLRSLCHSDDSVILGSWLQETDHKAIEDQMEPHRKSDKSFLQPNSASGSGALEHDTTALYRSLNKGDALPGPLPLGVAVIDMSVVLYGLVFPHVAFKHRLQMLDHFSECVRHSKATRQEAVQINIFTALLSALKALAEAKTSLGGEDVRKAAVGLIHGALSHPNPILRCAAGEALGRMAQVVGDGRFVAEMAQDSFDRLKTARDAVSRTGHSLALGCLHRYVGGMGSGQHLNTSVSILLALAQDMNAPVVQVWALHALGLIADSGGPMFRSYVEPTLSLALKLLLSMPPTHVDVHQCIGKCLSAVITTIGPELQGNTNSISTARSSLLVACSIMQDHGDALVQTEAISCLQQLHMFAPRHVNLSSLVPVLCSALNCPHLLLRRAAVACLRQLSQREAREVCEHASSWAKENSALNGGAGKGGTNQQQQKQQRQRWACEGAPLPWEAELPGVLFALLDRETDPRLVSHLHDSLTSMLQAMLDDSLGQWLGLCKDVLTAADTSASIVTAAPEREADVEGADEFDDDEETIKAGEEPISHPAVGPRWPTKVFAAESLHKIITLCEGHKAHFDLSLAREERSLNPKQDFLVLHLSDLVRMAFMAATSDSDPLRLEGLKTLQLIIDKFSQVPEPEFPGHVILEQYQAQVGAALRPAFSPETPSHVTAMACQVCSAWIGSGVARDLNDLRRVHQLLVSSLTKLQKGANSLLYNEGASTLEKLAILKAWAEVYIVAMEKEHERGAPKRACGDSSDQEECDASEDDTAGRESLLKLVSPELLCLSRYWLAALKDHALLSLPAEFSSQLPHDGGAFYTSDTVESARPHYRDAWPPILLAASLWLTQGGGFEGGLHQEAPPDGLGTGGLRGGASFLHLSRSSQSQTPQEINRDWFYLLFGICMEALCGQRVSDTPECVPVCLQALHQLLSHPLPSEILGKDLQLSVELCHVLHRMLLARDSAECQLMVMKIAKLIVAAWQESYDAERKQKLREVAPANQEPRGLAETVLATVGEGGENGELVAGQSVVHALLEVCLCLLVRQLPQLSPQLSSALHGVRHRAQGSRALDSESGQLIAAALAVVADLPQLCSPAGCMTVVPTILFLLTSVLKEVAVQPGQPVSTGGLVVTMAPVNSVLQGLKALALLPLHQNTEHCKQWVALLRSTLSRIIDFTKTSEETGKLDDISMLLAIAMFVLNAPKEVVQVANLQYPCINLFKHGLLKEDMVQLWCVQTLRSIFQHQDRSVSTPYIHSLGPRVVETLLHCADDLGNSTGNDLRLNVALECLQTLETLLAAAPTDGKAHMMLLYVPVLVNLLLDPVTHPAASTARRKLHQAALGRLTRVGPQYPQEFRAVIGRLPQLKSKIESAVRSGSRGPEGERPETPKTIPNNQSAPSIKLKTDFSNFTG